MRADAEIREAAVERLLGTGGGVGRVQARRFIEYASTQKIAIDRLWTELDARGRPRRSVLIVPNPGRTAIVFGGTEAAARDPKALARLIEHAVAGEDPQACHLVQALVEPDETALARAFEAAGFLRLADLAYLERRLPPEAGPDVVWPDDVSVETWSDGIRSDVIEILRGSYEDTLDCPALRGLRELDDILDGHLAAGVFDPALWRILRIDGAPSGVAMLNPSPASASVELVYLGLAPVARGRGLARRLLQDGMNGLAGRCEHTITLAVDLLNEPAIKLYRSLGFKRRLQRVAFIRPTRTTSSSGSPEGAR